MKKMPQKLQFQTNNPSEDSSKKDVREELRDLYNDSLEKENKHLENLLEKYSL